MRQLNAVGAVLCLLFAGGCAEFENSGKSTTGEVIGVESEDALETQTFPDGITVRVQPAVEPERYEVHFSWPQTEELMKVRIREPEQTLALVPYSQRTFSHEVSHDQTLTYTFELVDAAGLISDSSHRTVKVPRDYVVRRNQSEFAKDQRLNVQRLFLNSSVPPRTNGHRVEIIANEIISDDGLIETFPEGAKAKPSTDGRGGGNLLIRAAKAVGHLQIRMRGQHGGNGTDGKPYSDRAADGRAPKAGERICECLTCVYSEPVLKLLSLQPITPSDMCRCTKFGKPGTNGAQGAKGRPGTRAGHGGNSGELRVEIQEGSEFYLQTDLEAGRAGTPGKGGSGQPGGIAPASKHECSGARGKNGAAGPQGESGPRGADGKGGSVCVFIASEGKNDC